MTRITEIKVEQEDLKLLRPYTIAFKTVSRVENAIVRITLDNGIVGFGAVNPSEQVVGKNLAQTMQALDLASGDGQQNNWNGLIGREITDLEVLCAEIQHHLKPYGDFSAANRAAAHRDKCPGHKRRGC